ncbi:uncharacterized protein LOC101893309 isoform X2 [Musca domestica]|uniref:Uncharacterized protein LOC101893309 isoform X2 n=1 Tax=Musca domestica TaxID=7370 RepID=A0ABM3V277_MUSDO|nr:uncharacterized protein LOC101893309 isoform X2 [Musca domestica]
MRFNLLWTHWSLLFITLISSCFLFYVVASENVRQQHAVTHEYINSNNKKSTTTNDATLASDYSPNSASPSPPAAATTRSNVDRGEASIKSADYLIKNNKPPLNGNRRAKTLNILPNYKKVKKLLGFRSTPPSQAAPSPPTAAPDSQVPGGQQHEQNLFNLLVDTPSPKVPITANSDPSNNDRPPPLANENDSVENSNLESSENVNDNVIVSNTGKDGNLEVDTRGGDPLEVEQQEQHLPNIVAESSSSSSSNNNDDDNEHKNRVDNSDFDDNAGTGTSNDGETQSLPDITDIPTVTITELPLEILQPPPQNSMDSVIIAADGQPAGDGRVLNHTLDIVVGVSDDDDVKKDGQIVKINDSGGGSGDGYMPIALNIENPEVNTATPSTPTPTATSSSATTTTTVNIPNDLSSNATVQEHPSSDSSSHTDSGGGGVDHQPNISSSQASSTENTASQVNLTTEENPMPVFSEWAQKQMEEAEKQAMEQEHTFNNSAQRKNNTNGNGKPASLKIRAKNYASPDCGAKIIASSGDTSNAGAVLSSSKDEYMLSLCGKRIWFVVELCEAIQAQKIDFANFELYSSSPQNFTVAVSKRFPTREWSNVGRFVAEDKRAVQSFDLHPHLFGKFVRVDIHSHYSKEHFCTLSLFRVFGTSEFEAFETENHPNEDIDDFDDEDLQEPAKSQSEPNLFKSASDAVLSIVKKATELVGKPSNNQNQTFKAPPQTGVCHTPMYGLFSCAECPSSLVERVNNALSCEFRQLNSLLNVPHIRHDLISTRICAKMYGIETAAATIQHQQQSQQFKDIKQSFYVNILPNDYVGALCQLLAMPKAATNKHLHHSHHQHHLAINETEKTKKEETSTNQTLDKKFGKEDLELLDKPETKLIRPAAETPIVRNDKSEENIRMESLETSTEVPLDDSPQQQLPRPLEPTEDVEVTTASTPNHVVEQPSIPDKNIFNVPVEELYVPAPSAPSPSSSTPTHLETEVNETPNGMESDAPPSSSESLEHTTPLPPSPSGSPSLPKIVENIPTANTPMPSQTPSIAAPPHATPPSQTVTQKSEEDSNSWENIDILLTSTPASTTVPGSSGGGGGGFKDGGSASNQQHNGGGAATGRDARDLNQKISNGPQSESVFIRLSNRIKALERNMSLSGQYLEELSRRYKKQVEELQQTLTQQTLTVRTLEEQNRRHHELEQLYAQRNTQLKNELDDLTLQVHACIVVIIFVGAFVFLVLMVGILFYRSLRRDTKEVLALYGKNNGKRKSEASATASIQKKLNRRKSFEDYSDHQQQQQQRREQYVRSVSNSDKIRRPSEEAMLILKECKCDNKSMVVGKPPRDVETENSSTRQRKISICYGSNNNINSGNTGLLCPPSLQATQKSSAAAARRRGEKHSWPNTAQAQQQALQHLQELNNEDIGDYPEKSSPRPKKSQLINGSHAAAGVAANNIKSKKKKDYLRRQESSPPENIGPHQQLNHTAPAELPSAGEYDEKLMLDEDDLDNFIPNNDLAYNEFMPDGPRGYQCHNVADNQQHINANNPASSSSSCSTSATSKKSQLTPTSKSEGNNKKARRLSSPVFFKSPFTKSFKVEDLN